MGDDMQPVTTPRPSRRTDATNGGWIGSHQSSTPRPTGFCGHDDLCVVARFGPDDDYRPAVHLVVAAAATLDPPLPQGRLQDLRLAVTEACSNAVKVHRSDAAEDPVVVFCEIDDRQRFVVEVRDRGHGFDPETVPEAPEPEDPNRPEYESGLGACLIEELADEVHFEPLEDGTLLSMAFGSRPRGPRRQASPPVP